MSAEFRRGVRAMVAYLYGCTANHWHGRPEANAACDRENEIFEDWIQSAMEHVSPEDHERWNDMTKLYALARAVAAGRQPEDYGRDDVTLKRLADQAQEIFT